jgi:hypothetical protein
MKATNAMTIARRNLDHVAALEREVRRLRREREQLESALLAAKTAAAHLRDEIATLTASQESYAPSASVSMAS